MSLSLSLDAMGGDLGPCSVVHGAALARELAFVPQDTVFVFFGDAPSITREVNKSSLLSRFVQIIHTDVHVTNEIKPFQAIRLGRKTGMAQAVEFVLKGNTQGVISAGNTGAYMGLCKVFLKTLDGIDRPAIPALIPTMTGQTLVLDLGANVDCSCENLIQFALMGEALFSYLTNKERPSIGLLNVGSEELKGNSVVQLTYQKLNTMKELNFKGFVEGNDITRGIVDVVITDGFSGNIALKSIEGTAYLVRHLFKECLGSSLLGKIGYFIARSSFKKIQMRLDPRLHNGAVFLGLRHVAVKSHGSADALSMAHAIRVAYDMIQKRLVERLQERLSLSLSSVEGDEMSLKGVL